jgi:hypothetical protein
VRALRAVDDDASVVSVADYLPGHQLEEEQDVNIWSDIENARMIMFSKEEKPAVIAGSLNRMIEYITSDKEKQQGRARAHTHGVYAAQR